MVAHWSCPVPQMWERKRCHLCPAASGSAGAALVDCEHGEGSWDKTVEYAEESQALPAHVTRLQTNRWHLCCNDELLRRHDYREEECRCDRPKHAYSNQQDVEGILIPELV